MNIFVNTAYASVDSFIATANRVIINPIIVLMFSLALLFFLYGVFEFLSNQENEQKITDGKQHMLYGIIGLTIMMGVFTIMRSILNTLNIPESEINPEKGKVELR
jgi:hypothetical protein